MAAFAVFKDCVESIRKGELIKRVSRTDKEYHFQNWFQSRLARTGLKFDVGGRNSYPDFRMVATADGFELKGLAYPGRVANFDSNSQVPTGFHNGRTIYYVFGRYPKTPDGKTYPVLDLVLCHGDLLNANHEYVHKNKNVKGFGTYGDLMIRDRKMYVVPTPFWLLEGVAHNQTLILPAEVDSGPGFIEVGLLSRLEAHELIVGYSFDLRTNEIQPEKVRNPTAGREHLFRAWRLEGPIGDAVTTRASSAGVATDDIEEAESDE